MPELAECSNCHAAVPLGAFCSVCGQPLVVVAQVVDQPLLPIEGTILPAGGLQAAVAPDRSWVRRNPAVVVGVAVLVAGGAWLVQGNDEDGSPVVVGASVRTHTIGGDISVLDVGSLSASDGSSCYTSGGYTDIRAGGQVVVVNESGTTLATSTLGSGRYSGLYCVFSFSVEDVGDATFYQVTTGNSNRGGPQYSVAQLAAQDWTVHLSLD